MSPPVFSVMHMLIQHHDVVDGSPALFLGGPGFRYWIWKHSL